MARTPPAYVEAPAVAPYKYGLFSAATLLGISDPHQLNGVEFEPVATITPAVTDDDCSGAQADLALRPSPGSLVGIPFTAYAGIDCAIVGRTPEEHRARALAALSVGAQFAAERALWVATATDSTPVLTSADTNTIATGVSFLAALAALEDYAADHYRGIPVIHAPRWMAVYAAKHAQLVREAGQLTTPAGTIWSFEAGATNQGPGGVDAAAGHGWMYVTGQMVVRRADPFLPAEVPAALNRMTNDLWLIAEQTMVIQTDMLPAAVDVDLALGLSAADAYAGTYTE